MKFKVNTGAGLDDNVMKAGNRDATRRQTEFEHNQLLDITTLPSYKFYEALPEGPRKELARRQLMRQAIKREQEEAKYWDDETPREPIFQSSSWVGDIDYDPYANLITVALGNGTTKATYGNEKNAADYVNAPSIGKKVNRDLLGR